MNTPHPFKYMADKYIMHIVRSNAAKRDEYRALQVSANRTDEKIMRYVIVEDMLVPLEGQATLTYTVRVSNGEVHILPNTMVPDVTIWLDTPSAWGLLDNRTAIYYMGKLEVITPFTIWDGVRLKRIRCPGQTTIPIKELYLFDRVVLPVIGPELRRRGLRTSSQANQATQTAR